MLKHQEWKENKHLLYFPMYPPCDCFDSTISQVSETSKQAPRNNPLLASSAQVWHELDLPHDLK